MADFLRAALEPTFLNKLHRLRLTVRHSLSSRPGNTPMAHGAQATGLEVAAHRAFVAGDDLRYLDWNAYGRLDQLLVKTFRAEREAPLDLLIDVSASMGVPSADAKLDFACAVAASLAYVSLRQQDPIRLVALGGSERAATVSPPFRHLRRLPEIADFLRHLRPEGPTALVNRVDGFLRGTRLPALTVVLSDFLVPHADYEHALAHLQGRGGSVAAVRILGARERDPAHLPHRVRLRDAESGAERVVTLTSEHRRLYGRALDDHLTGLKRWCNRRGIVFAVPDTAAGLEACLFHDLPRAGLVH